MCRDGWDFRRQTRGEVSRTQRVVSYLIKMHAGTCESEGIAQILEFFPSSSLSSVAAYSPPSDLSSSTRKPLCCYYEVNSIAFERV